MRGNPRTICTGGNLEMVSGIVNLVESFRCYQVISFILHFLVVRYDPAQVTPGGEAAFIGAIVGDSLVLREQVRWYTAMLGKKQSLRKVRSLRVRACASRAWFSHRFSHFAFSAARTVSHLRHRCCVNFETNESSPAQPQSTARSSTLGAPDVGSSPGPLSHRPGHHLISVPQETQ